MQLHLNENEIKQALLDFIKAMGVDLPKEVTVQFKAGRKNNGNTATLIFNEDINDGQHHDTDTDDDDEDDEPTVSSEDPALPEALTF